MPEDIAGYEGSLTFDKDAFIPTAVFFSGPAPVNLLDNFNWLVEAGSCFSGAGPTMLVQFEFFAPTLDAPNDALFCLGPTTPSSFAPAAPGYLDCADNLVPFGVAQTGGGMYPNACAVANASDPDFPIATDTRTWSAVKANF